MEPESDRLGINLRRREDRSWISIQAGDIQGGKDTTQGFGSIIRRRGMLFGNLSSLIVGF